MNQLKIKQIIDFLPPTHFILFENDFLLMELSYKVAENTRLTYPCKFEGVLCMYCIEGNFSLSIGLDTYDVSKDYFAISLPGDIVYLNKKENSKSAKIRVMAISNDLLKEMEFDIFKAQNLFRNRIIKANTRYKIIIHNYRNIFKAILLKPQNDTKQSLGFLLRSMNIEISHIWFDLAKDLKKVTKIDKLTSNFFFLLSSNHINHRDLEFYALNLNITPKYLSAVIKGKSGRTAIDWIATYTILEAKYYLLHTEMKIKEIAYALNYKNPIDFYRYFQRQTGISPTDYRKRKKSNQF